jgi:hypothetical protein
LLNTVLVFARARTATFHNLSSWNQVSELAKRLNSAADSVGASYHQVELVRRGPKTYFLTCSRSPRFNWNISLSHRDVGKNLDFFAPGHMTIDKQICSTYFIEKRSFEELTGEIVLLDYLKDDAVRKEFDRFNTIRERLFNSTMEQLGLDYRFKCLVVQPGTVESVPQVMARSTPPNAKWWEDHCFFVNGFLLPGILLQSEFAFCGFETKHEASWRLLQLTFEFIMKYKRYEYWHTSADTGKVFWKLMEQTFRRIRTTCERDLDEKEFNQFYESIKQIFKALGERAGKSSKAEVVIASYPQRRPKCFQRISRRIGYRIWSFKAAARLHLFQGRRLQARLSRNEIGCPDSGERDAFEWWC